MSDLFEFVLELVCNVLDALNMWRFSLSVLGSIALTAGLHYLTHSDGVRLVLAVPLVLAGIVGGMAWEWLSA